VITRGPHRLGAWPDLKHLAAIGQWVPALVLGLDVECGCFPSHNLAQPSAIRGVDKGRIDAGLTLLSKLTLWKEGHEGTGGSKVAHPRKHRGDKGMGGGGYGGRT
jgi:hypothetical protein